MHTLSYRLKNKSKTIVLKKRGGGINLSKNCILSSVPSGQWVCTGDNFALKANLTVSGNIFGCHNYERGERKNVSHLVGGDQDAAKYRTMCRKVLSTKSIWPRCQS